MDETKTLYGYALDDIDEIAGEVFEVIAEAKIPITLAILVLCRTITMIGNDTDLDLACVMIDQLKELADEPEYEFTLEDEVDEDSEV